MVNLLYISALIAAIAFAVLVIYLAGTLKAARNTLTEVAESLDSLQKQMEGITVESTALLNKANQLTEDIQKKSEKLNHLVDGIYGIGDSVHQFNRSIESVSNEIVTSAETHKGNAAQVVTWGQAAIDLWKRYKKPVDTKKEDLS
ncbi:DUF948 domain-containing protein [Salirhabdus salicampi]|uniref:DUF948 domain-containing protein n=1 Tax=Salirhabdus salicampi TaxID=476102 RepID=UPI0020C231C3|nr:DUF948 domain-containing protein [Salirhabdus salicampi]MCP8617148.1 DUF948 domain-containing protein [Salirhabdus salicampi]